MSRKFIIGIDLGGTNLKIATLDLKYRVRHKAVLSTKRFLGKKSLISAIIDSINNIIKDNHSSRGNILGVGLGLPGPVDEKKGIVHFFPNIPGWKKVNLKDILEKRLKLPVFLDNDVKLMTLAEYNLGAAKGFKNAVCLTLGTGVGGGIVIGGNLYRGFSNAAGEIGHIPINERGPRCNCGGIACLETYVGNNRIISEAKRLFKKDISLEEISKLARKQNKLARAFWHNVAGHLASCLVGIVNLLNPDAIIIGGGIAGAGKILFNRTSEIILKQAMSLQARHVKILKAKLGNEAGLIGAAVMVKKGLGL